jgi:drug/metabolite transporter (DMT)-like permease
MASCSRNGVLLFTGALVAGTGCSIMSKILLEVRGTTLDGSAKAFDEPVFQTIGMFTAMMLALVFRFLKRSCFDRRYQSANSDGSFSPPARDKPLGLGLFFLMALPSTFDLLATYLCTFGLMYVPVSVYQMLRGGSSIAITSILKHFFIEPLELHHWVGVGISVVSILLCAQSATCGTATDAAADDAAAGDTATLALWGFILILLGGTVQAMQVSE